MLKIQHTIHCTTSQFVIIFFPHSTQKFTFGPERKARSRAHCVRSCGLGFQNSRAEQCWSWSVSLSVSSCLPLPTYLLPSLSNKSQRKNHFCSESQCCDVSLDSLLFHIDQYGIFNRLFSSVCRVRHLIYVIVFDLNTLTQQYLISLLQNFRQTDLVADFFGRRQRG